MNLLKSLASISGMTFLSRVLGFIRDAIIACYFGAGAASDAFIVAFKLPNLLRRIFAEGAFSQAFVPILSEYKSQQGDEAAKTFVSYVAGLLTLVLAIITVLGIIFSAVIIYVTAPGFTESTERFELASTMLKITFPYIFLISLSSLCSAVLNTWNRFTIPAFVPSLLNISMILCAIFLAPYFDPPILALAVAVVIGGFLQLIFQFPSLKKIGMLVLPRLDLRNRGVIRVLKLMIPALIGVSVSQISLIINTIFASFLATGSVSWMYYADRLMEFPTGILGVALGTILLPSLAKSFAKKDYTQYSELLDWGLRLCFLLSVPSAVALAILSKPLISTLFEYGEFTALDTAMTQQALVAYTVGLVGLILIKVLAPAFYSQQNIKTPVIIAIITLILTQGMNLLFIGPMKHAGLSLSIGLAACINAALLYWQLRKRNLFTPQKGWLLFISKISLATAMMGLALWFGIHQISNWSEGSMTYRMTHLLLFVMIGIIIYFAVLFGLKFRIRQFIKRI